MILARIVAPHFVAGIEIARNATVIEAAPIVRYMIGWSARRVKRYVSAKRWSIERVAT